MADRDKHDGKMTLTTPEKLAERLPDREDLARRLDALTDELATTRDRLQDLSTQVGQRATRRGRGALVAGRAALDASRGAFGQARGAAAKLPLPAPGRALTQARRTGQRLLPFSGDAKAAGSGRSWRLWLAVGAGVAALGGVAVAVLRRVRGDSEAGPAAAGEESGTEPAEAAETPGAPEPGTERPGTDTDGVQAATSEAPRDTPAETAGVLGQNTVRDSDGPAR